MASRKLPSIARSALKNAALVSLSAGISASIVLHKIEQSTQTPPSAAPEIVETIRAKRVEVVNGKGEVCLLLHGSDNGGAVEWRRPGRMVKGEEKPIFAHLGSYFPGHADFGFSDPTGDSSVALSMSIGGMPQSGVFTVTGLNGKEALRVDTWPLRPTVTVRSLDDGSVKFQK